MRKHISVIFLVIFCAGFVAGCASNKYYTGNEYYYTSNGIRFSCREPKPYKGGNCKPESLWEKSSNVDL